MRSRDAEACSATALRAHDRVVGLVSIEHSEPDAYTEEDASLIAGLASSLALAVDNARWFSRLRTLGAEAERARIARDLHDNVAQSLAYVGFELDRLAAVHGDDPELRELQGVVRGRGGRTTRNALSAPGDRQREPGSGRRRPGLHHPLVEPNRRRDRVLAPTPGAGGSRCRSSRSCGGSSRNPSRTSNDMPMPPMHGSAGGSVMVGRSSKFETTDAA